MNKISILFVSILVGGILLLTGCSDDDKDIKVNSITIKNIGEDGITLETTDVFNIEVDISPSGSTLNKATYKTSDETVFTVSAKGAITARNPGEAILTVKSQDGTYLSQIRTIKVVKKLIKVEKIEIQNMVNNALVVSQGVESQVKLKLMPVDASESVVFTSGDPSVFTVNADGIITGIKAGEAELTVSAQTNPAVKTTCMIKVEVYPITNMTLPESLTIRSGDTFDLKTKTVIAPTNASNQKLDYILSDNTIIKISEDGIITALKSGVVTITATTTDGTNLSSTCVLTVSSELDNSTWDVTCSDEKADDGGGRMTILDDSTHGTYWHSQWAPNAPLPHWLIIDMQNEQEIAKVMIGRRSQDGKTNTDTKLVKIEVSTDGTTFAEVGKIDFGTSDLEDLDKSLSFTPVKARYVKLIITESNRTPFANIAIFKAYSKE